MNKRVTALLATVGVLGILACASPPSHDPNPQPDHKSPVTKACPRIRENTICVEFYADEATTLKVRVTGLNGKGVQAPITEQRIDVFPGGGAVGFSLPLDDPPVSITGRAQGPKGILIGCRVVVRGLEIPDAANFNQTGTAVCLFVTS